MNETLRVIAQRYSCRAYDGCMPEKEKLEAIALAAVQAPSAMNRQPWQIFVLCNKNLIDEMDEEAMCILAEKEDKATYQRIIDRGGKMFYDAPCMFLVLKQPNTEMDSGIVSQNIALAAASLGLSSVICGMAAIPFTGTKAAEFKQKIGFSEEWEFGIAVLVGYAKQIGTPHEPDGSKIHFVK